MVFVHIPRAIGKLRLPLPPVTIVRQQGSVRQQNDYARLTRRSGGAIIRSDFGL